MAARSGVRDIYPLSPMQEGMLFHALAASGAPLYLQQYVLALRGADEAVLTAVCQELVERHTVLRTGFVWEGVDRPVQVVFDRADSPLTVTDLRDRDDVDTEIDKALTGHRDKPFDLARPPLLRIHALRTGTEEWILVTTHHHIVLDGWSVPLLQAELAELLAARADRRDAQSPPARAYGDFIRWLRSRETDDGDYWRSRLSEFAVATPLGVDRVGRVSAPPGEAVYGRVIRLDRTVGGLRVAAAARKHGLLPSTVVHAAWGLLLARYSGQADVVYGMTTAGRPPELPEADRRLGMFVNTLPLRVRCAPAAPVSRWLAEVQQDLAMLREREQTPLRRAQGFSRVPANRPLYESVVAFQNYWRSDMGAHRSAGVDLKVLRTWERTSVPVAVAVALPDEGLWVRLDHDASRIDDTAAAELVRHFADLVGDVVDSLETDDGRTLADLTVRVAEREATDGGVAEFTAELTARSGGRAVVLLASDDPAAEVVAALCEGAGLSVTRVEPGSAGSVDPDGVRVLIGPSRIVDRLSGPNMLVVIGDEPATVPCDTTVFRLVVVGRRWTAARLSGPRDAGRVAAGEVLTVTDAHGDAVPDGVEGTLRALGEPTGRIARVRADGDIDISGFDDTAARTTAATGTTGAAAAATSADATSAWAARILATHPEVADAAVVGPTAWIVPRPGRTPTAASLTVHAGRHIPPHLAPTEFEVVDQLPLDARGHVHRAALAAQPPTRAHRRRATPLQDRLAAVPAQARAAFLDAIRNLPERGPRPGQQRGEAVRSVQHQQLEKLRDQVIAATATAVVRLPEAPSATALADALRAVRDRHGLGADLIAATVDPAGDLTVRAEASVADANSAARLAAELAALVAGAELPPPPAVTYADYAAWQREDRRHADLDAQRAVWRTALAGAPALGLAADRVPADAVGIGEETLELAPDGDRVQAATWLAAVAAALARRARTDDLVIGAVLRPDLPASTDGVVGAFDRMLPIRVPVDPDQSIAMIAGHVSAAVTAAAGAADVPWSELRALLAEDVPVSVAVHSADPARTAPHSGTGLALDVSRTTILARFDRTRWHPALVRTLLADIAALATTGVAPVDGTDPVRAWGDGGIVPSGDAATIHSLVRHQAVTRPDAVAVDGPTGRLTYRELAAAADGIGNRLRALGIGPEDRVGVCVPRGPEMVIAALGVLASGAAYVPIDPHSPEHRTEFVLADSHAATVVTVSALREKFASVATIVAIDETQPVQASSAAAPQTPDQAAAYILYTSGSTGRPKGVVVEHRAAVNFVRHIASAYRIGPDTRLLGFALLTFDISVFDIWTALTAGATLVLAGDDERRSVDALQRLLQEYRVDAAELPPSLLPLLDAATLPALRLVSVGGEAPSGAVVDAWAGPDREVWNGYGPTETTVAVTLHNCRAPSGGRVPPIGSPMPNHRVYVVDDALRLVPPGVPGELCVAGIGLARGYLGSPAMTAGRFVPDPHAVTPGQRMYRTGDLVRWTGDGILEFLGRVDRQVKIRGFRVEPGEVEAVLAEHAAVTQVVVEPRDVDGIRHLVAYVVSSEPLELAELRESAARRLPDYMLPTRTLRLEELPLTPHGKVDRRALSGLDLAAAPAAAVEAAADESEQAIITDIISPLLGGTPVGPNDGFFALGGNSLQATQVTSRVRDRFGVDVDLADFFADPTPRRLAQMVEEAARVRREEQESLFGAVGAGAEPENVPEGVPVPLAFPQERMWRMDVLEPGHPSHHAPFHIGMSGDVDAEALQKAVQSVVDRHAPLRAVFTAAEQRFLPEVHVPLRRVETDAATVPRLLREEAERPFDLRQGPMIRTTLYHLGGAEYVFQWNVHHIVTDAWSVGRMLGEVFSAYNALCSGRSPAFDPLPAQYRDFVRWQRDYVGTSAYERELGWWRAKLAGLEAHPALPADHPRGAPFTFGWRNVRLDAEQGAAALATARRHGVTFYMLALAAWSLTLTAETEWDELVVAAPVAGRIRTEWEPLIGYFVNRVLTRVPLGRARRLGDLLDLVRAETAAAFAHQTVPFETLVADLALPPRALATCFSVQNAPAAGEGFSGLRLAPVADDTGRDFTPIMELYSPVGSRFEAGMVLRERAGGVIAGGLEYNASLFGPDRAERWHLGFAALLDRAAADPSATLADLRRAALGG